MAQRQVTFDMIPTCSRREFGNRMAETFTLRTVGGSVVPVAVNGELEIQGLQLDPHKRAKVTLTVETLDD